jgi:hypothetical protein
MREIQTTFFYGDDDQEFSVQAVLIPGMKGLRDRYGVQETPDDPDEIEIQSLVDENGIEVWDEKIQEKAEAALWEKINT